MSALEIASVGQRFGAFLVDFVISVLVGVVGLIAASAIGGDVNVVNFLVSIGYWIVVLVMVATRGQSPGKIAIGIKIVKTDGRPIGFGTTLLREVIGKIISSIIILLGYIWILFDGQRQGWHDKIASTYVVKV
ncbi:MAG: RDD family protein [Chloroflexi bacterium]|nr:RDD family protein [Chloroflexota bacterium]MYK62366.1 RDD family protein [Chloroflexota bacterium]